LAVVAVGCGDDGVATDLTPDASVVDGGLDAATDGAVTDDGAPPIADAADGAPTMDATAPDDADSGPADPQPEGHWAPAAPVVPGAIQEVAVVAVNDEIYVLGGFDSLGRIVPTVSVYTPSADTWRRAADLPAPMHHANAAALDGKIYVLGSLKQGFEEDGRGYVYDPGTDAWRDGPAMPPGTARGASGVAVLGNEVVLVGGLGGRRAVSLVSAYDVVDETWRQLPDLPQPPRDHMAVGTIDGQVVVAGGRDGRIGRHVPDVNIYDPMADQWRDGAPMPTSRGGAAGTECGGSLYVIGGEGNVATGTGVFNQVEAYRLAQDRWDTLPNMLTPRHGTDAAAIDGWLYVPGGAIVQAFGATETHERMRCGEMPGG
jgi:N-acetylneuraminic acid mutarotase